MQGHLLLSRMQQDIALESFKRFEKDRRFKNVFLFQGLLPSDGRQGTVIVPSDLLRKYSLSCDA